MEHFGERLRRLRGQRGMTVGALAATCGVKSTTLARLENDGTADPRASLLLKIAKALHIPLSELIPDPNPTQTEPDGNDLHIVGESRSIVSAMREAQLLAALDEPFIITGETGTGKELFARWIHRRSRRASAPFFPINCAALPPELATAELFGNVRGAFTGAVHDRSGAFEATRGGTVFLDEIGSMPLHLQVLILRVLENRTITRLGESIERPVDCRIIAATNQDVEQHVRTDLFFRMKYHLHLAPLREKPIDIPLLIAFFMNQDARRLATAPKSISGDAMAILHDYAWPGNVRQLEHVIDLLMITVDGPEITASDVSDLLGQFGFDRRVQVAGAELFRSQRIPYYFGPAVSDPSRFYGRQNELSEVLQLVRQSEFGTHWPIAVIGDHRVGKSSLLRILDAKIPQETKSLSFYIDLASIGEGEFFETIAEKTRQLVDTTDPSNFPWKNVKTLVDSKVWKSLKGELEVTLMGFVKLKKSVASERDWSDFREILVKLLNRIREGIPLASIVIIVDEISACANWQKSAEFLKNWRSLIQNIEGYNFLIADAHPLHEISKNRWSAFFNVFRTVPVGSFTPSEAEQLITRPAAEVGVSYDPDAIARIRHLTACKPYYIQVICCSLFEWLLKQRNTTRVTTTLVDIAIEPALKRLGEFFPAIWETFTDFQKRYLIGVVQKQSDTPGVVSVSPISEVERSEIRLLYERQIISKDVFDQVQVEPLFSIWLTRYYC